MWRVFLNLVRFFALFEAIRLGKSKKNKKALISPRQKKKYGAKNKMYINVYDRINSFN